MLCKLTDENMCTNDGAFQWKLGQWRRVVNPPELCVNGFHYYHSPELAVLFNPIHAGFENPKGYLPEARGEIKSDGAKLVAQRMRLVEEIALPYYTPQQSIAWGILCAKEVYHEAGWQEWADNWLSGKKSYAVYAARAARAACAARAARAACAEWAAYAAWAACAESAAYAARAAYAENLPIEKLQELAIRAQQFK